MVDKEVESTAFYIFEAHSRKDPLLLYPTQLSVELVNSTSPAVLTTPQQIQESGPVVLRNPHPVNITAIG